MARIADQIETIEITIEEAKAAVQFRDEALELSNNALFKKLILNNYFKEEPTRIAQVYAHPSINADQRAMLERDLHAVGALRLFMQKLIQMGDIAAREIKASQETLDELRSMRAEDVAMEDDEDVDLSLGS